MNALLGHGAERNRCTGTVQHCGQDRSFNHGWKHMNLMNSNSVYTPFISVRHRFRSFFLFLTRQRLAHQLLKRPSGFCSSKAQQQSSKFTQKRICAAAS